MVRVVLLLWLAAGLLTSDITLSLPQPTAASAPGQGFTIIVYDYTGRWGTTIEAGVQRWDAGLTPRGIRLSYSRQAATPCESLSQPAYGIAVCDTTIEHPNGWQASSVHQGVWATDSGIELRGLVQFYRGAPASSYADMMVCHELGHTLQLGHVAAGSDSCMTPVPQRVSPSESDIANALLSIPNQKLKEPVKADHKKKDKGKKGGKRHR